MGNQNDQNENSQNENDESHKSKTHDDFDNAPNKQEPQDSEPKKPEMEDQVDDGPMMPIQEQSLNNLSFNSENQEKIYEMQWDCPQCGTKKLLGKTHRFCPACGNPQDPDKRYFPSEEEKVAVHDHEYVGIDKLCSYCNAANSASALHCTQCGAPMEGTANVSLKDTDEKNLPQSTEEQEASKKKKRSWIKWTIIGTLGSIIGFCGLALFWKKTVNLEVINQEWSRSIEIQQIQGVRESKWCPAPIGAYNITSQREMSGSKQIPDGQTCRTVRSDRGDGTYSQSQKCTTKYRSEPVYDQKCYYTINRWRTTNKVVALGGREKALAWPQLPPLRGGNSLGSQRTGARVEKYTTFFQVDGKEKNRCEYTSTEKWNTQKKGTRWKGKMGVLSNLIDCDDLQKL